MYIFALASPELFIVLDQLTSILDPEYLGVIVAMIPVATKDDADYATAEEFAE